jgi:hypothetical protein
MTLSPLPANRRKRRFSIEKSEESEPAKAEDSQNGSEP